MHLYIRASLYDTHQGSTLWHTVAREHEGWDLWGDGHLVCVLKAQLHDGCIVGPQPVCVVQCQA